MVHLGCNKRIYFVGIHSLLYLNETLSTKLYDNGNIFVME